MIERHKFGEAWLVSGWHLKDSAGLVDVSRITRWRQEIRTVGMVAWRGVAWRVGVVCAAVSARRSVHLYTWVLSLNQYHNGVLLHYKLTSTAPATYHNTNKTTTAIFAFAFANMHSGRICGKLIKYHTVPTRVTSSAIFLLYSIVRIFFFQS